MSLDISESKSILRNGNGIIAISQQRFMSLEEVSLPIRPLDARALRLGHYSVSQLANIRAQELEVETQSAPNPTEKINESWKIHAQRGIKAALRARQFLRGDAEIDRFHAEFVVGHIGSQQVREAHAIQLHAFTKILGSVAKDVVFDPENNLYLPTDNSSGRGIKRAEILPDADGNPGEIRFADLDTHHQLVGAPVQNALRSIAGA